MYWKFVLKVTEKSDNLEKLFSPQSEILLNIIIHIVNQKDLF